MVAQAWLERRWMPRAEDRPPAVIPKNNAGPGGPHKPKLKLELPCGPWTRPFILLTTDSAPGRSICKLPGAFQNLRNHTMSYARHDYITSAFTVGC